MRIFVLIISFCIAGCQDITYFEPGEAPVLVLNSILEAGENEISLRLTRTEPIYGDGKWETFPDAEIRIFEDGKQLGHALYKKEDLYTFPCFVRPGSTYRIEASAPGLPPVWGETTIPVPVEQCEMRVSKDEDLSIFQVDYSWKDHPHTADFYWLDAQQTTLLSDGKKMKAVPYLWTHSALPDPLNRIFFALSTKGSAYEHYIRIGDYGLDGKAITLSCTFPIEGSKAVASLHSVDKHYDAYLKSVIENSLLPDPLMDYTPLTFHNVYIYSNIHGGTGLVASRASLQKASGR